MQVRQHRRPHPRAGFTLMEMMVVVAIIVALAGMSILYYAGQVDESNKAAAKSKISSLESAVTMYYTQHNGTWPDSLQALLTRDPQTGHGPYVTGQDSLLSPWGVAFQYDASGPGNNNLKPDIWCDIPGGKGRVANYKTN